MTESTELTAAPEKRTACSNSKTIHQISLETHTEEGRLSETIGAGRVQNFIYRMIDYFWKKRLLVFMITFVKRLSTKFTFC